MIELFMLVYSLISSSKAFLYCDVFCISQFSCFMGDEHGVDMLFVKTMLFKVVCECQTFV